MSETAVDISPKPPSLVEGPSEITEDLVFSHVMERVLSLNPICIRILKIWMKYHRFNDFHFFIDAWFLLDPDTPSLSFRPYKIGPDMHDLPNVIYTKLILLTLWDFEHFKAKKSHVPDSLWMTLTKDDFEQWCLTSNYELPDDSEMTSISLDLTEDFDDFNLASLFDLPADDETMSIFADIADNCDNLTLASIVEPPNAQNHTSVNPPGAYGLSQTSVNLSAQNGEHFNACTIKNDQETKDIILDIDDSDQVSKKTIVDIQNPDEDATRTMFDIENQELAAFPVDVHLPDTNQSSLVDNSLELYHHGENAPTNLSNTKSESPKEHNTANTTMTNQPLLSPLCDKH
ncbi:hypothetical protein ACA910_016715 [Epithemia clementina (nom. ined.)]